MRHQVPKTILTGWWYTYPSEKYDFVSWDDEIPNLWKNLMFETTNQLKCWRGLQGENPPWLRNRDMLTHACLGGLPGLSGRYLHSGCVKIAIENGHL
jgi:hypothetical protein